MRTMKKVITLSAVLSLLLLVIGCDPESTVCSDGHTWDEGKITKEATCIEEGEKTYTCTVCNKTKTEVIEKTNHIFGDYKSNDDATTSADGTKTRICSVCGYEETITDEGSKLTDDDSKITGKTMTVYGKAATISISENSRAVADSDNLNDVTNYFTLKDDVLSFDTTRGPAWDINVKTQSLIGCSSTGGVMKSFEEVEDGVYEIMLYSDELPADELFKFNAKYATQKDVCGSGGTASGLYDTSEGEVDYADGTYEKIKVDNLTGDVELYYGQNEVDIYYCKTTVTDLAAYGVQYVQIDPDVDLIPHEHTWNNGEVTKEATMDEEGEKTYTCSVCGETKTETIDKLPSGKLIVTVSIAADSDISVTKTATDTETILTADDGYALYEWSSLGKVIGEERELRLSNEDYSAGTYVIDLQAQKDGEYYSASVSVTFAAESE